MNDDDYEGIAEPEPCEYKVAEEKILKKKRVKQAKKDVIKAKRDEICKAKKADLCKVDQKRGVKKYKKWLEAMQEKWTQEDQ